MPTTKEYLGALAERYGAPIGVPESPGEATALSKKLLKAFGEFFVDDMMLGGSSELGDGTLTGNQDLLETAKTRRRIYNDILGMPND